jgi:hypothetical protein
MKGKKNIAGLALALSILVLITSVAPLPAQGAVKTCEDSLNKCLFVASLIGSPIYNFFCFEGYVFCKKYVE